MSSDQFNAFTADAIRPMLCPECHEPVEDHWSLALTDEERRTWKPVTRVCHRSRGEVMMLIEKAAEKAAEPRLSRCSSCGSTFPSNPSSSYFSARPERDTDSDWDGCNQGMGT